MGTRHLAGASILADRIGEVRRGRGCLLRNRWRAPSDAEALRKGLPFGTRVSAICVPLQAAAVRGVRPCGSDPCRLDPAIASRRSAARGGIADASPGTVPAASSILGHLAFLPGAGRLHVNVGWRHPRPVAANDADIVSGNLASAGIGARACAPCIVSSGLAAASPRAWPLP